MRLPPEVHMGKAGLDRPPRHANCGNATAHASPEISFHRPERDTNEWTGVVSFGATQD